MNSQSVFIADWTKKSCELFENVRQIILDIGYEQENIPNDFFYGNSPISIVFAGQYSAGKSSIVKALTGIKDIPIGVGITTQKAQSYNWNGIEIVDTPGIHTTLRPDHDEISYHAIANADMLVYVVTQELFDSYIGEKFRKLLIEKDKAAEMILVVNKMAAVGNTPEIQAIKLRDIERVTQPYSPKQLRTVFIDAESYLDSLTEDDSEIAEALRERSGYESFVSALNDFVKEKSVQARMTTALYKMDEYLQNVIVHYQPSTGDSDLDAVEEHLLQERRIIVDTKWRIESAIKAIIEDIVSKIKEIGRELANKIYDYDNESDANDAIQSACNEVDHKVNECNSAIVSKIEELSNDLKAQIDDFYKSDFSISLSFRLNNKHGNTHPLIERFLKSDILSQGGRKIVSSTLGKDVTASGLKSLSGSNAHQLVLDIGHFFGHNFKPWEALKFAKGLKFAGRALGVVGVAFSLGMQVKEDVDADAYQKEMRSNRDSLRASFYNVATEVETHFINSLSKYIATNYISQISELDQNLEDIRNVRKGKSDVCALLEKLQKDCRSLITSIHEAL